MHISQYKMIDILIYSYMIILMNIIILEKSSRLTKGDEFHATINFDGNNSENKFAEENLLSPNDQTGKVEESNKERNCRAGVWSREKNQKRGKTVEEPFAGKSRWYSTNVCETRCLNSLKGGGCLSSESCGN